jgi:hypothetical protein
LCHANLNGFMPRAPCTLAQPVLDENGSAEEVLRAVEAVQAGKFMLAHSSRP